MFGTPEKSCSRSKVMLHKVSLMLLATFLSLSVSVTSALASSDSDTTQPIAELGFVNLNQLPTAGSQVNPIRQEALRETATTLGARGALAWRSEHINGSLNQETTFLDHLFNFNQLLLKHNVLPPVLMESDHSLNLADNDTIRMADQIYQLIAPAKFVTAAPTWRDYLWMSYTKPDVPDQTLLPVNKAEAQIWNFYLVQGWENGLDQANDIFAANLSRLKRDYLGMVLYRKLLAQGMITSPQVAKAELGVTGNADQLRINDEVMRITAQSALQPDSHQWKPVLTK
ncbi:MAG: type IV secretion system protein DotC [Gammaproteobacteria bacterium RIFCSPHIGHO2_12_FULL_41_15]|nr:MAG: type IV secretion system protein DotC [Gammaproteobacteria bacterium RIFCSPHIGHO2_12_FULL_41_15]